MQQYNGFWVPQGNYGKRFFNELTEHGFPAHCESAVIACLAALDRSRWNGVAVDGGAYVGSWSMHLLRFFRHVIAFEPIRANADCCTKNMVDRIPFGKVWELEEAALSNSPQLTYMFDVGKSYSYRLRLPSDALPYNDRTAVVVVALDDYDLPGLDLLKLDVEGHEYEALLGAFKSIQKHKPVVFIEEKLDPHRRASKFLYDLGMRCVWQKKHDYLFSW